MNPDADPMSYLMIQSLGRPAARIVRTAALLSPLLLGACAVQPVQPWEKATLALPTMTASGSIPLLSKFDQHVYVSKETVSGGTGIGGGGCGCK